MGRWSEGMSVEELMISVYMYQQIDADFCQIKKKINFCLMHKYDVNYWLIYQIFLRIKLFPLRRVRQEC